MAFAIGASHALSICISSAYCGVFCHQFSAEVFQYLEDQRPEGEPVFKDPSWFPNKPTQLLGEGAKVVSFGPVVRYAADLKILFKAMPFKSPLFKELKVNDEVSRRSGIVFQISILSLRIPILGEDRRPKLFLPFSPCNLSLVRRSKSDNYLVKQV